VVIDTDAEVTAGLASDLYPLANDIDDQMALGEQFHTLDLSNDNDLGHGQSDYKDGVSDNDDPDVNSDGMSVDVFSGRNEGGSGDGGSGGGQIALGSKETTLSVMNKLLMDRQKKRKNCRP
jgi:hypothetical protein